MSENNPDILEQNRRINELTRKVAKLEMSQNTLEQAIEPQCWISQAFEKVEEQKGTHPTAMAIALLSPNAFLTRH